MKQQNLKIYLAYFDDLIVEFKDMAEFKKLVQEDRKSVV
jgi:hypothetical protein